MLRAEKSSRVEGDNQATEEVTASKRTVHQDLVGQGVVAPRKSEQVRNLWLF